MSRLGVRHNGVPGAKLFLSLCRASRDSMMASLSSADKSERDGIVIVDVEVTRMRGWLGRGLLRLRVFGG
jgi:hypothetical protein